MSLSKDKVFSIMESLLFMSPDPRPLSDFETLLKGLLSSKEIKEYLLELQSSYEQENRGMILKKVSKGWQLRTKTENKEYLLKLKPPKAFRLSKPSLEVLSIVAFEQPCAKMKVDEIRGVDSGHLLRNLLDKELICMAGQSDLPGKPFLYKTSQKFLEIFGLKHLKDLPSIKELEELFETKEPLASKKSLETLSTDLPPAKGPSYLEDEKENKKIKEVLKSFSLNVDFLEKDKSPPQ